MELTKEYFDESLKQLVKTEDFRQMSSNFKELLSDFEQLGAKVDSLHIQMSGLDTRVGSLDTKVSRLDTRVGSFEIKLNNLETTVSALETEVSKLVKASTEWITARELGNQLASVVKQLENYVDQSQEEFGQMVSEGFLDILTRLDVRKRVDNAERNIKQIGLVLNLELED